MKVALPSRRTSAWAVVLGLCLTGSLAASPSSAQEPVTSTVKWDACPDDVAARTAPTVLECATLSVPRDYAETDGARTDVMISRLASTKPEKRRGMLMLNPGGPGGSGLPLPAQLVARGLPASVLDSYDLIGMDTRGVGHSSKISCGITTETPYIANVPPYAIDDAAVLAQAKVAKTVADQCARHDEGLLRHLTTANIARDIDFVRDALGEEKTSYLGYSYGTALGAAYTSMFPERSDRIVLDSNLSDTYFHRADLRRFAYGMEKAFPDFAKWAAARHESYGLGRTPAQVRSTYFALAERLDDEPLEELDGSLFRLVTFGSLYNASRYPTLAQQWQGVKLGDGSAARHMRETAPSTGLAPSPVDNALSAFLAVTCNDSEWPKGADAYRRGVAQDRARYPLMGASTANITPCAFWPHAPAEPPVTVNDDGPRNILLVQNLRDPATPHPNSVTLRQKFGDRTKLLTIDDGGHGAYAFGSNSCALNTTTRYLVDGDMPRADAFCAAD
ncbi:alpha/beta hydrolase [Streptomyces parvulus]|uniref:alpha/beta hydrolase n=1 Tax=Streptomyces parvulus TaxID=146923 RepID=UPI003444CEE5